MKFDDWFEALTGVVPFPYQARLATVADMPELLEVPTGAGKTAAAILGWLWRRRFHPKAAVRDATPRRLVFALPMRSLVEQTHRAAEGWLDRAGLKDGVGLHVLMGGAIDDRWQEHPERDAILIGTQDQLVSRALNRGYAMSRYRWPMDFALLNNDVLWVLDEVQLMGAALPTTVQLAAFRAALQTYGPGASLWMSATVDPARLATVDRPEGPAPRLALEAEDRAHPALAERLAARKVLRRASARVTGKLDKDAEDIAREVAGIHAPGSLSLVICNRVSRAQEVYRRLAAMAPDVPRLLVHSRYRRADRLALDARLADPALEGIVVATQAVEAGVDLSARLLVTELAPWASLVQRFGRCNRFGRQSDATVHWVDVPAGEAAPYAPADLDAARALLGRLSDVGPDALSGIAAPPQPVSGLVLRRRDLLELFDTSSDLAGHDLDVSRYIRDTDATDVSVAWRTWDGSEPPPDLPALAAEELCRVPVGSVQALLRKSTAWSWDELEARWLPVDVNRVHPGLVILLSTAAGGYSSELGFSGSPKDRPEEVEIAARARDADGADPLTRTGSFVSLEQHVLDARDAMSTLADRFASWDLPSARLVEAAQWHDLGKAHPAFQAMLVGRLSEDDPKRSAGPWAKSDHGGRMAAERAHFRHELVSALIALREGREFLLAYLVAAHHGKVRLAIRPRPTEPLPDDGSRRALGVLEGDPVPAVSLGDGVEVPGGSVSLAAMELGRSADGESWTEQAANLLGEWGPFRLAFLETLVRVADWRASRMRAEAGAMEATDA